MNLILKNPKSLDFCTYSKLLLCLPAVNEAYALIPDKRPSNLGVRALLMFSSWQTLMSISTWEAVVKGVYPSEGRKLSLRLLKRKQREATTSNPDTSGWALNGTGEPTPGVTQSLQT